MGLIHRTAWLAGAQRVVDHHGAGETLPSPLLCWYLSTVQAARVPTSAIEPYVQLTGLAAAAANFNNRYIQCMLPWGTLAKLTAAKPSKRKRAEAEEQGEEHVWDLQDEADECEECGLLVSTW